MTSHTQCLLQKCYLATEATEPLAGQHSAFSDHHSDGLYIVVSLSLCLMLIINSEISGFTDIKWNTEALKNIYRVIYSQFLKSVKLCAGGPL